MDRPFDPLELLFAANPVPDERVLAPTSSYVPAQRTLQQILRRSSSVPVASRQGRRASPRNRRLLVLGAAVGAVALVAAAAVWVLTSRAPDPAKLACYAAADLDADTAVLTGLAGGDPVAACEEEWRTGSFREWGGPPALAACVLPGGAVGVFPGEPSVCDRLGLPRQATESGDWEARVNQLVDGLTATLTAPSCVDVVAAAAMVRERLDQLDLEGWTLIAPATTMSERPCASIAFDPPAKTITLVPVPLPGD